MAIFTRVTNRLRGGAFTIVTDIKRDLVQSGKDASGSLVNSVRFEIIETGKFIALNFIANKYWFQVDKGRKKGTFPNVRALKKWIRLRGGPRNGATLDQAAFLVGRKIKEDGIKGTNIFTNVTDRAKKIIDPTDELKKIFIEELNQSFKQ